MTDDQSKSQSRGGFDDWLGEEPGPTTNPYSSPADDESDGETADRVVFSQTDAASEIDEAPEGDVTAEIVAAVVG
ncbi:MAG: hypothetical protein QGD89_10635, partial [Actinomycetota bacterium]|nr:hypothetical protein [Actinomycetota bacterium]